MMKANELMIGDWVKCTDPRCEGHQVDLIDNGNEEVGLDGEIDNFENIIPIPLTPEILEKNGFKNRGAQFFCDNIGMIWWKDNIFMFSKYTRHEDLPTENISINIGYVHELQHALKLCGIDKEVEL